MYIGDPHNVAAIISPGRNLAKPKSAEERDLQIYSSSALLKTDFSEFLTLNFNYGFFINFFFQSI